MGRRWSEFARGRVNPFVPGVVALAGLVWVAAGHSFVGGGIAVGAALAYVNGVILSRRVDLASLNGDMATAMMVMQAGLLVTMTIIGIATIILIKISVSMAIASAAGFAVAHLGILAAFYVAHGRREPVLESKA